MKIISIKDMSAEGVLFIVLVSLWASVFFTTKCWAADEPRLIYFSYLTSPDKEENSSLSGECSGNTASYEIECKFWQIRVRLSLDPDNLQQEIQEAKRRMKDEMKDFDKDIKELCDGIRKRSAELKQLMTNTDRFTSHDIKKMQGLINLCDKPTYEKFEKFMIQDIEDRTRTCKVSADPEGWTAKFTKVAENKWVSSEGPTGPCSTVILMTLEHEPSSSSLWTYTRTRTYVDQESEACRGLEVGKPLVYTWREKTIELNCQLIEYGF
jgi:hypothetical protein